MGQGGGKGQRHYSKDRPQADCLKMGSVGLLRSGGERERGREQKSKISFVLFCFFSGNVGSSL